MPRSQDVWNQLKQSFDVEVDINEAPYATSRTTPNLQGDRDDYEGNQDQFKDFPYIEDPKEYQTYKAMEQDDLAEQETSSSRVEVRDTEKTTTTNNTTPPVPGEENMGGGEDLGAGGDVGGGGELGGMGMGMGQEQEQTLTSNEIGKVYEMKKIYSRMTSLEAHLSSTTDTSLLTMRGMVSQAMDLFETVVVNFDQYKEQINEIIVTFYKFLDVTYEILRSYYKNDAKNEY